MNDTILIALIGLAAVQLGHLLNNLLQARHTNIRLINEKKREIYFQWITAFCRSDEIIKDKETTVDFISATSKVMLIAPDNVIEAMADFLAPKYSKDFVEAIRRHETSFFTVIRKMRQDCRAEVTRVTEKELKAVVKWISKMSDERYDHND